MAATRTERVVSIKRAIKDVVIQGLRDVFDGSYAEPAFESMRVVHEYPKDAQQYPCIVVRFKGRKYPNAGVGHYEIFPDPNGVYRRWEHRRFEGELEFECCSLSSLERDKLSDALLELLSFGSLTAALNGLLVRAYGDVNDPYNPMSLLFQINLNTDELDEMGDSADLAPWQAEDALIYTSTFSLETTGGFYNSLPTDNDGLRYIQTSALQPYLLSEDLPFSTEGDPTEWSYSFSYFDDGEVTGSAVISSVSHGADYFDHGHVIGKARISALEESGHEHIDMATIFAHGVVSGSDEAAYLDAASVIAAGIPSSTDDLESAPSVIVQTNDRLDDGTTASGGSLAWDSPTIAGSHLFMVVGVRGAANVFGGISITPPAGWTLVSNSANHGVENGTGAGLFVFYKLASASRSGTESVTFLPQNIVSELPIRWSMQLIEVSAAVVANSTPILQASGTQTTNFKSGYDSGNLTGGGSAFTSSGTHQNDAFVMAFFSSPDLGKIHHLDDANSQSRADGWATAIDTVAITLDSNSPALVTMYQPDANDSTSDLRLYCGDDPYAPIADVYPAQAWLRFA